MKIDSRNSGLVIALLFLVLIISFFGYFIYQGGLYEGSKEALANIGWMVLVVFIICIIIAIFYILFILEKRVDVTYEVFKAISGEGKISKPNNLKNLYIKGDKIHKEKKIGNILGWSQRMNYKIVRNSKNKKIEGVEFREDESCFLVNLGWFKKALIRCPIRLHSILQGDIYMNCVSLTKHSLYYYPSNIHLDFDAIDETIFLEGMRYLQLDLVSKMEPLVIKATGLNKEDIEELEGKRGIEYANDFKGEFQNKGGYSK